MNKVMLLAVSALFSAGVVCAALTAADLTPQAIRTATAALQPKQRQDYARQIIEAVAARPEDETAKTQALTTTARALIAGARSGGALAVIAEIFNSTPVTNLQGVSDLLATNNFGQKLNGMSDEQFDAFATKLIASASEYIIASGTDSPTLRVSILAAAFSKASTNPERTRSALIAALPASMQAAAGTYIAASESNNANVIAAAAGVDAVEPTPADPDAGNVVQPKAEPTAATPAEDLPTAPAAQTDYLEPEPAATVTATDPAGDPEAKVPLIARLSTDVQGMTLDAMHMTIYEWDAVDPDHRAEDPHIGSLPGLGAPDATPGEAAPNTPAIRPEFLPDPSPSYGNQRTK